MTPEPVFGPGQHSLHMRRDGETGCDIVSFGGVLCTLTSHLLRSIRAAHAKVHAETFLGCVEVPSSDQRGKRCHLGFPHDTEHEALTQVSPEPNAALRPRITACYLN